MKIRYLALTWGLVPTLLLGQTAGEDARALVPKYAALLKTYPQFLKEEREQKRIIPMEDTLDGISIRLAHEKRPEIRQVLLVARHFMADAMAPNPETMPAEAGRFSSALQGAYALELAGEIPPDSPALELIALLQPTYIDFLAWHNSGGGFADQTEDECVAKAFEYLEHAVATNSSKAVKAAALVAGISLNASPRDIPGVEKWLSSLEALDPAHPAVPTWKTWLAKAKEEDNNAPKVGKPVPAFQVQDLDHPGVTLTAETFKGKYYLLDFWATWCGPCKGELPFVHKAYAQFHPAGLEILSLSQDRKVEDIHKFRKDPTHPMPWRHAFPQGADGERLVKAFQVRGIPFVLLIGPDGRILETVEALRGENLVKTLGKYIKVK